MSVVADEMKKPPYGSPCNGCGQCCADQLCPLGAHVFELHKGRCPALTPSARGWSCGLVDFPRDHAPTRAAVKGAGALRTAAATLIGAGLGCDAIETGETVDEATQTFMRSKAEAVPYFVSVAALKIWGMRP